MVTVKFFRILSVTWPFLSATGALQFPQGSLLRRRLIHRVLPTALKIAHYQKLSPPFRRTGQGSGNQISLSWSRPILDP
ncbi:hypothetical protein CPB83DRAFT_849335 [Crepidotus variabilis]|uniref:Secreted protein n=1 Tax=Crepidotus variabilis TaxID=179855 RepID=A0A9P6ELL8_9AGAR|nr:hypothetical protein CPB83DRAFT_849335 [Crepidotus variabilis]